MGATSQRMTLQDQGLKRLQQAPNQRWEDQSLNYHREKLGRNDSQFGQEESESSGDLSHNTNCIGAKSHQILSVTSASKTRRQMRISQAKAQHSWNEGISAWAINSLTRPTYLPNQAQGTSPSRKVFSRMAGKKRQYEGVPRDFLRVLGLS